MRQMGIMLLMKLQNLVIWLLLILYYIARWLLIAACVLVCCVNTCVWLRLSSVASAAHARAVAARTSKLTFIHWMCNKLYRHKCFSLASSMHMSRLRTCLCCCTDAVRNVTRNGSLWRVWLRDRFGGVLSSRVYRTVFCCDQRQAQLL